jgi:hypothetical protein
MKKKKRCIGRNLNFLEGGTSDFLEHFANEKKVME